MKLLETLVKDEKINDQDLYSSGPYWNYKNEKTLNEIKKKGIEDFRGLSTGIGTSFVDNQVLDIRNELNFKGKIVAKFFSMPLIKKIFQSQINITKDHLKSNLVNLAIVYKNNPLVQNLIKKYNFKNTTQFGCISKFKYLEKEYSTHYLDMAYRIENLSEKFDFKKIRTFFEIGGGFGANIHFLITNFPNIKKVIYLDAVPNIYIGTEYLRHHFKDKVKDYLAVKNKEEICFENNEDLEIICIPPWEIERVNVKIDHFHNAESFVEMPEKSVKNYIKFVEKFDTKEISLISYDNFDLKTTFDPNIMSNFFNIKLNVSWKNRLIEGHIGKDIYLTN